MSPLLLSAALSQLAAPAAEQAGAATEIVVTGTARGRCRVELANRALSRRELAANAEEWAALGTPVRVVAPAGADYKCLAKIAFRLNERGVRFIHFVRPDPAPEPPPAR